MLAAMKSQHLRLSIAVLVFAVCARSVSASPNTVYLDPGATGTSFTYKDFFFSDLAGTQFDGQTISLDILFSEFLLAPAVSIDLLLNQDGGVGTIPNQGLSLSAYLLDEAGLPASPEMQLPMTGWMPGQIWPGWPFVLNGAPFLPPTTNYSLNLEGTQQARQDANLGTVIDIDPLVFWGIHYAITFPETANMLIGSRLTISDYSSPLPILVSPDPVPEQLSIHVPDSADTRLLFLSGLLAMIIMRARLRRSYLA